MSLTNLPYNHRWQSSKFKALKNTSLSAATNVSVKSISPANQHATQIFATVFSSGPVFKHFTCNSQVHSLHNHQNTISTVSPVHGYRQGGGLTDYSSPSTTISTLKRELRTTVGESRQRLGEWGRIRWKKGSPRNHCDCGWWWWVWPKGRLLID